LHFKLQQRGSKMQLTKIQNLTGNSERAEDIRISIFRNHKQKLPFSEITLREAVRRIKEGTPFTGRILRTRAGKLPLKWLKASLPLYCFSGIFSQRNSEPQNLKSYSSLVVIDFDKVNDLSRLKREISKDPFTLLTFISPSGSGLKVLIRTDNSDPKLHKNYYEALKEYFSRFEKVDKSGSDISRGCYDSYDPEIFFNPGSEVWKEFKPVKQPSGNPDFLRNIPEEYRETDQEKLFNSALLRIQKDGISIKPGERNNGVFLASQVFNRYGVTFHNALSFCLQFEQPGFSRKEIEKAVQSAYSRPEYFGIIKPVKRGKFREAIQQAGRRPQ